MTKEELKQLSYKDLAIEAESLRKQLFSLRMQLSTGQVKDYSQFKKLRGSIARTLTFMGQKGSSEAPEA